MGPEQTQSGMPKFSKGKRPQFYPQDGLDEAMSMILVLAEEFSAMRDRLDTVEQIAAEKGIFLADEIEAFAPDAACEEAREVRRNAFLESLYYLTLKRADEQANNDDAARYSTALEDIAKKG